MKKNYEKPMILFEDFTMSTNIAGNCDKVVDSFAKYECTDKTLIMPGPGGGKIIFISDNVHLSGLPEGKGEMAGVPVKIEKDKLVVDTDERYSLAGSCLRLCDSIKNVMRMTGKSAEEIIKCATENPARYIGVDDTKGYIAKGYDADINIFDKDFLLVDTYVKGKKI